jgi:hypothetical protein
MLDGAGTLGGEGMPPVGGGIGDGKLGGWSTGGVAHAESVITTMASKPCFVRIMDCRHLEKSSVVVRPTDRKPYPAPAR